MYYFITCKETLLDKSKPDFEAGEFLSTPSGLHVILLLFIPESISSLLTFSALRLDKSLFDFSSPRTSAKPAMLILLCPYNFQYLMI